MIKLSEEQIENKLFLFAYLRREDIYEREICYSCINGETKNNPFKCSCDKKVNYLIPDFKLYERYLTGQIVTEIGYYLEPYSRYIYVLNQKNEILRVFDMNILENKKFEDYDGFDISINYHISNDSILSYLYFNFKLMSKTIEPFFDDYFFELLDEKLSNDLLMSFEDERIEKISILYPWKNYIPNLEKLLQNNHQILNLFIEFQEYIEKLNL